MDNSCVRFEDMPIAEELKRAIGDMGFSEPTAVQSEVIPHMIEGRDVIAQAPTGTGKTCAFAIPIISNIDVNSKDLQALVLCPTRELSIQIAEEFKRLLKYTENIRIAAVYGGQNIDRQLANLRKKPQIICATPGRALDHIERRTIKLHNIKMLVLDEADEMLDMGFRPDLDKINHACPRDKQVVLFSATMPKPIVEISRNYQVDPVSIVTEHVEMPAIEQIAIKCKELEKVGFMTDILDAYNYNLTIAFCNTKKRVEELTEILNSLGYNAEGLHGDLRQSNRDRIMKKYRAGQTRVLVATDVAARGIDVDNVEAIFNFDPPNDEEFYVHRIGRTARANRSGVAYTFYTKGQADLIACYEKYTGVNIIKMDKKEGSRDFASKKLGNIFKGLNGNLENTKQFILRELENYNAEHGTEYTPLELLAVVLDGNGNMIMTENTSRRAKETKEKLRAIPSVRFFVTIGMVDNTDGEKLKKYVMAKTHIPGEAILEVKLLDKFGFVEVMEEYAENMAVLSECTFNGRKISCEVAGDEGKKGGGKRPATNKRDKVSSNADKSARQGKKHVDLSMLDDDFFLYDDAPKKSRRPKVDIASMDDNFFRTAKSKQGKSSAKSKGKKSTSGGSKDKGRPKKSR